MPPRQSGYVFDSCARSFAPRREGRLKTRAPKGSASGERRVQMAETPRYGSDGCDADERSAKRVLRHFACRSQVADSRLRHYTGSGVVSRMQMDVTMQECIENCEKCAEACKKCGDACEGMDGMEECVRLCRECEVECRQCIETMKAGSNRDCAACAIACAACAEECEMHDHPACQECAAACRACAETCGEMAASI